MITKSKSKPKTTPKKKTPSKRAARTSSLKPSKSVIHTIEDLLDKLGDEIEPALYALLCDDKHDLNSAAKGAVGKGSRLAMFALAPAIAAQFALTPAVAVAVVGVVAKELVTKGPDALCEELAKAKARRAKPKTRTSSHRAAARKTVRKMKA